MMALLACLGLLTAGLLPQDATAVDVQFHGLVQISRSSLRKALVDELEELIQRGGRRSDVDDLAFLLESYCLGQGFPKARVDWRIEELANRRRVHFDVQEGVRTLLKEVRFRGNESIDAGPLESLINTPRVGLLKSGAKVYVESAIAELPAAIQDLYRWQGHLDAVVVRMETGFSPDSKSATLTVTIQEGVQYRVWKIKLPGAPGVAAGRLDQELSEFLGQPYERRRLLEIRSRILAWYGDLGHSDCVVEVVERSRGPGGEVVLQATIEPGPRVRVSSIEVRGNQRTRESVILGRLEFRPGDWARSADFDESYRRLFRSGLFQAIDIHLEGTGVDRTAVIQVEERPTLEVSTLVGYGSYELLRAEVGLKKDNLFGTGRSANLQVAGSLVGEQVKLTLSDPFLFHSDFRLDLPAEYLRREEPSFVRKERSAALLLRREWSRQFSTGLRYELKNSESLDVSPDVRAALEDDVLIGSVRFEMSHDTRDSRLQATRGHRLTFRTDWADQALGSQLDYWRNELSGSLFQPLHPRWTLALRARTAFLIPLHSSDVIPIQERLFLGGENSVRGFSESNLGPRDAGGDPIGGEVSNTLNGELQFAMTPALQWAVFYDLGNVALRRQEYFEDFRGGPGMGLRYLLPVGSLRLDVGTTRNPRDHEDRIRVHFAVGMAF